MKQHDEDAARYVHWGATSQDILDTACILQCRDALQWVERSVQQNYQTALAQAQVYRDQVMIGRTWLQQALPITLGHKFARWASAFKRDLDRIQAMKARVLAVQLGGAVGSLASLLDQGSAVVEAFAQQLQLSAPSCTWHGERDRIVEIASVLGMIVGNTGKMARDWSLMMQTEWERPPSVTALVPRYQLCRVEVEQPLADQRLRRQPPRCWMIAARAQPLLV